MRTTAEINKNLLIKVHERREGQKNLNILVGVSGFRNLVGDDDLAARLIERAFSSMDDKIVCKLRRGLKVTFYYK
jgi:hypothetical protein